MEPEQKSNGAFIGLTVIIIILIIGVIFIWQANKSTIKMKTPVTQTSDTITDQDATALDALESDSETIDTDIGVNANAID